MKKITLFLFLSLAITTIPTKANTNEFFVCTTGNMLSSIVGLPSGARLMYLAYQVWKKEFPKDKFYTGCMGSLGLLSASMVLVSAYQLSQCVAP